MHRGLAHGNEVRAQSANYKACDICVRVGVCVHMFTQKHIDGRIFANNVCADMLVHTCTLGCAHTCMQAYIKGYRGNLIAA